MKTLHYIAIATFALLCTGFASCDKNDGPETSNLLGKWQHTWSKGYEKDDEYPGDDQTWDHGGDPTVIVVFAADGTGYFADPDGDDPFDWVLDGSTLKLSDGYGSDVYTLQRLNAETFMIVEHQQKSGYEYYSEDTYTKID